MARFDTLCYTPATDTIEPINQPYEMDMVDWQADAEEIHEVREIVGWAPYRYLITTTGAGGPSHTISSEAPAGYPIKPIN